MTPIEQPILVPTGDLTIFEAAEFRDSLVTLLGNNGPVELDLSGIQRMDGAGLQLVLAATRYERCSLTKIEDPVRDMMELVGCAHQVDTATESTTKE